MKQQLPEVDFDYNEEKNQAVICAELLDLLLPHKKQKLKLPWLNNRFIKIFFKVRCKNNEVYYRICGIKVKARTKI